VRLALSGRESRLLELYLARYPPGACARSAGAADEPRGRRERRRRPGLVCERLATIPRQTPRRRASSCRLCAPTRRRRSASARRRRRRIPRSPLHALLARAEAAAGAWTRPSALRKAADAGDARAMYSLADARDRRHAPKDSRRPMRSTRRRRSRPRRRRDQSRRGAGRGKGRQEPAARLRAADAGVADSSRARPTTLRIRRARLRRQDDGRARFYRRAAELGFAKAITPPPRCSTRARGVAKDPAAARTNCSAPLPPIPASRSRPHRKTQNWSRRRSRRSSRGSPPRYYSGRSTAKAARARAGAAPMRCSARGET